jgi:hypothetical protein
VSERLLLCLALLLAGSALAALPLEERAQAAVTRGDLAEARALYRALADGPAGTDEHRIWVARLSSWLKDFDVARTTYLVVLRERPDDTDVLLGLARVETWSGHFDEADRWLDEVEALAPDHPELADARTQNRRARSWHPLVRHRDDSAVTVGFQYEDYDVASAAHMAFVRGAVPVSRVRPWAEVQYWDKFDENTPRLGIGLTARPWPRWSAAGEIWTAPGSDVLAEFELRLGAGRALPWGFGAGVDYRHMRFSSSRVHVATGTVEYYFPFPVWVSINYHHAWTTFDTVEAERPRGASRGTCDPSTLSFGSCDDSVGNDSVSVRYHHQLTRRLRLHLGYSSGTQSFQALSVDGVGRFRAQAFSVGTGIELSDRVALRLGFAREMRDRGGDVNTVHTALTVFL